METAQRKSTGDGVNGVRDPPPYPGHPHKLWQQSASYSTSSETSTDLSMSSLESLSTCARQDPQGEETAVDVTSPLMDGRVTSSCLSSSSSLSNVFIDDFEPKQTTLPQWTVAEEGLTTNSVGCSSPVLSASPSLSVDLLKSSSFGVDRRPVSACAPNSLIRQLLQTSPQYRHLLAGIEPLLHKPTSQPSVIDGRCLPTTPSSTTAIHGSPLQPASTHRFSNKYINDDVSRSSPLQQQQQGVAGRKSHDVPLRPSTAPAVRTSVPVSVSGALSPVQSVTDAGSRHHSFEVLDRVSGATLPRSATNASVSDVSSGPRTPSSQRRHRHHQHHQQQQQTTSPRHPQQQQQQEQRNLQRSSPPQPPNVLCSQPVPLLKSSSPRMQNDELNSVVTTTTSSLSVSPSVDQQQQQQHCSSPSDSQRGSPQTACAHAAIATRATQMVERLSEENRALRQELRDYYKKVNKLEKVERNVQKVSEAYETLVQHSQKRENLEKLMRLKLDGEVHRLTEVNQQVQDHLEQSLVQLQNRPSYDSSDSELKAELRRKDALIARFIAENRELTTSKLRLESDLAGQRVSTRETQSRLELLEKALTSRQVEHQLSRQQSLEQQQQLVMSQMSTGISTSDVEVDAETENGDTPAPSDVDFQSFKHQQQCDTDDGISSDSESPTSVHSLIRQMQDKERHVRRLEVEVARLEQKFLEEAVFRQLAVDAISIPKDAKIAALMRNSADTDNMLAAARLEKLAYIKELHVVNERCACLETKLKELQADLAERDTLIHVLQHHSSLSRASSISSLLASSSPLHSPHSPSSVALSGSRASSGASSRQGSQLSAASNLPFIISGKFGGSTVSSAHVPCCAALDSQTIRQMLAVSEPVSRASIMSAGGGSESDQLHQCFWQV